MAMVMTMAMTMVMTMGESTRRCAKCSSTLRLVCLALVGLVLLSARNKVEALKFEIHQKECFDEEVKSDNEMVSGSFVMFDHDGLWRRGGMGMDFTVIAPGGRIAYSVKAKVEEEFHFRAVRRGIYRFCFENLSSYLETVVFHVNVGHHVTVDSDIAKNEHMKPVIDAIDSLADILSEVESERQYLEARGERHYDTLHSTQRRMLGYTMLEAFALLVTGVTQAYLLKRLFEKKGYDRV
ncbi:hypothetical protein CBR_g36275 [Chara braunii]|uniref:GOLD domain-containing protein n=1 Tax=Chara braunii TaxID=69332 RepID=A0A388LK91_CHABU|nr:hypothetical protein CBR_g36275 [Chara braunii]|eukprot:GBG82746.1 hypothetical protein CBR_g36275 [Chara braunii]